MIVGGIAGDDYRQWSVEVCEVRHDNSRGSTELWSELVATLQCRQLE